MIVLGIETSCDETSAAVVRDGREVLSNVISTQIALHQPYGGVVPEIAARSHVEMLPRIIEQAVQEAGVGWGGIDEVAVTYGPGLASSLLIGLSAAKALAMRLGRPLVCINHLEAHAYSPFLNADAPAFAATVPFTSLIVSGGHSCLVRVEGVGQYTLLGQTIDDAAGEAFDKGANLLGLGYPGGPAIDKASRGGDPKYVQFPKGRPTKDLERMGGLPLDLCFSFSGLKTALLYYVKNHPLSAERTELPSIAASYQEAIVDALLQRTARVVRPGGCLAVGGGVSLNRRLRERLQEWCGQNRSRLLLAEGRYCADNAAMIAGLAGIGGGIRGDATLRMDVNPNLEIGATLRTPVPA